MSFKAPAERRVSYILKWEVCAIWKAQSCWKLWIQVVPYLMARHLVAESLLLESRIQLGTDLFNRSINQVGSFNRQSFWQFAKLILNRTLKSTVKQVRRDKRYTTSHDWFPGHNPDQTILKWLKFAWCPCLEDHRKQSCSSPTWLPMRAVARDFALSRLTMCPDATQIPDVVKTWPADLRDLGPKGLNSGLKMMPKFLTDFDRCMFSPAGKQWQAVCVAVHDQWTEICFSLGLSFSLFHCFLFWTESTQFWRWRRADEESLDGKETHGWLPSASLTISMLSRHWAWLHQGYWRYRSLIDWLIDMLMIASCMFPFASEDSASALNGLVTCLASVQSCMSTNKLKLNPGHIKLNSSLSGTNDSGANASLCFLLSFSVSKLTKQNLLGILEQYLTKIPPFSHIHQQSAAPAFIISGICGIFTITLIWIVQSYLQLLLCIVVSINAIHCCMVSWTSHDWVHTACLLIF